MIPPFDREKAKKETEQYLALADGAQPDRIVANPLVMGQSALLHGKTINDWYTKPKIGAQMLLNAVTCYNVPLLPIASTWAYGTAWCEDYGGEVKWPTGNAGAPGIAKHPYSKPEEVDSFQAQTPEEISKGPTYAKLWEAMEVTKKTLGPLFNGWGCPYEPFVIASYWFGPEQMLLWVNREPKLLKDLVSKTVEFLVNANELAARKYGGANLIVASLLANSQTMSPQNCWDFSLRYTKEMVEKSLKAGAGPIVWYHQCGDHEGDCKLHADLPLPKGSIMHPTYWGLKPAPLAETAKIFGSKCIVMGNVDTASFLNKTSSEIYEESKQQVEQGKSSGFKKGFIAGIGCEMPPYAPYANVEAFMRAVREHGKL